jgi:hypothetical protein
VLSDILKAVDSGDMAGLVLLDLSAGFDTVDHDILLRRLNASYGINGTAIQWFRSYLTGGSQYFRRGSVRMRCTTRIGVGAYPVCSAYRRLNPSHRAPQSLSTSLCGRYSSLRILLTG